MFYYIRLDYKVVFIWISVVHQLSSVQIKENNRLIIPIITHTIIKIKPIEYLKKINKSLEKYEI